jgi:hypothetical protein
MSVKGELKKRKTELLKEISMLNTNIAFITKHYDIDGVKNELIKRVEDRENELIKINLQLKEKL